MDEGGEERREESVLQQCEHPEARDNTLRMSCSLDEPFILAKFESKKKYKKEQMFANDISYQPSTGRRLVLFKTSIAELVETVTESGKTEATIKLVQKCPVGGILYKVIELKLNVFLVYAYGNPVCVISGDRVLMKRRGEFPSGNLINQFTVKGDFVYYSGYQDQAVAINQHHNLFVRKVSISEIRTAVDEYAEELPPGQIFLCKSASAFYPDEDVLWVIDNLQILVRIDSEDFKNYTRMYLPNMDFSANWNAMTGCSKGLIFAAQINPPASPGNYATQLIALYSREVTPQLLTIQTYPNAQPVIGLKVLEATAKTYLLVKRKLLVIDVMLIQQDKLQLLEKFTYCEPIKHIAEPLESMLIIPVGPDNYKIYFGTKGVQIVQLKFAVD